MFTIPTGLLKKKVPPAPWSIDATSGIAVPANTTEWSNLLTAASIGSGNPSNLWLMQEASGNLADAIGSAVLSPMGTPSYAQTITGWTRKAGRTTYGSSALGWAVADGVTGDLTTSQLLLAYCAFATNTGPSGMSMSVGKGNSYRLMTVTGTPVNVLPRIGYDFWDSTGIGSVNMTSSTVVHPVVVQIDVTNNVQRVLSELEVVNATWGAPDLSQPAIDRSAVVFGGDNSLGYVSAEVSYLYGVRFAGAAAELSDTQIRTLLQTLGWTVAW